MRVPLCLLCVVLVSSCVDGRRVVDDDDEETFEGDHAGECEDGADNDRDGLFDCEDEDCVGAPSCAGDDDDSTADDDDSTADDDDSTPPGDDDDSTTTGPPAFMYANTNTQLYAVDPVTYTVSAVAPFNGQTPLFGMTDIAIDLQGRMWGISFTGTYEINPLTAAVTPRGSWTIPAEYNSLTFLTDGRLLAGSGSTLHQVNQTTGALSALGTVPGGLVFAGDMVGLPDGRLYCLMAPTAMSTNTSLVVYNPATEQVEDTLPVGEGPMYGVGYALGTIFGFTEGGTVWELDGVTGDATAVNSSGPAFWGAATNPTRWTE